MAFDASRSCASSSKRSMERSKTLRKLLQGSEIVAAPCAHDALSARMIESRGFSLAFMSGFTTSASRLAVPDLGLTSYYEMLEEGRLMHEATNRLPIIGDADTGYGDVMNVKRTVKGYADGGFAGILLEDQTWPKRCGHTPGKSVVGRREAVSKIRAACDARDEGKDIVIVARTDAYSCMSLDEALWRVNAFADEGADMVFIDALGSREDLEAFARISGPAKDLPKMASMLEGGKTPLLTPQELENLGYRVVAYPLSLLSCSMMAMDRALDALSDGRLPDPEKMFTFEELKEKLGFYQYYKESMRYTVPEEANINEQQIPEMDDQKQQEETVAEPIPSHVEVESEFPSAVSPVDAEIVLPGSSYASNEDSQGQKPNAMLAKGDWLCVKVTEGNKTTFDARIPAGWLGNLKGMLPNIQGLDLNAEIRQKLDEADEKKGNSIIDMQVEGQRIQVYLE